MANKKNYLDQEGFERLVLYIRNELGQKANKDEVPADVVRESDLAEYAKKDEIITQLPDNLVYESDIADVLRAVDLEDFATKDELEAVEAKASAAYHVKGSVANLEELQAIENPSQGDVYNLEDTGINAVWTGSEWDELGTFVDLTDYLKSEEVDSIDPDELNAILYANNNGIVFDAAGLKAMLGNVESDINIKLTNNLSLAESVTVASGKSVVVDLNGYALSGQGRAFTVDGGEIVLKNGSVNATKRIAEAFNGGRIIVDDISVNAGDCAFAASGANSEVIINSGSISAQEAGIVVTTGASAIINGGEIEGRDNAPIMGNGTAGQGDVNIVMNGGKLIAHIQSAGYIACGVYMPNSGSFTMNNGEIISDGAGIVMRGGQVNLNGGSVVAQGASGVVGKVGDSRVVVGPYAVVYDESAKYPAANTMELNIARNVTLNGTDGDISTLLSAGAIANINDER